MAGAREIVIYVWPDIAGYGHLGRQHEATDIKTHAHAHRLTHKYTRTHTGTHTPTHTHTRKMIAVPVEVESVECEMGRKITGEDGMCAKNCEKTVSDGREKWVLVKVGKNMKKKKKTEV